MKREKMSTKITIVFIILLVMILVLFLPIITNDSNKDGKEYLKETHLNNSFVSNGSGVIAASPNQNDGKDVTSGVSSEGVGEETKKSEEKKSKSKELNAKKSKKQKKSRKHKSYKKKKYTKEDYELLAKVIFGESGYYSDRLQRGVGSVVLNRVKDKRFPNTIREVLYQKNQYACIGSKYWDMKPNKSSYKNAKFLLENGSQLPEYVIFQANFKQGDSVHSFFERTYFSYYMKDKKEYQKRVLIKKNKQEKKERKEER